jgi:hypothetical protein
MNKTRNQQTQAADREIFEAFPAPRGWNFGGDEWSGAAHMQDTTEFMPVQPATKLDQIEIKFIRKASAR